MLVKGIFCFCLCTAVLFKSVFTQCIPLFARERLCATNSPSVEEYNVAEVGPVRPFYGRVVGGNLIIDTSAPHAYIGPAGVTVFSDNLIIEGAVLVRGSLPFLGTVGLEGVVPSSGISAVNYGCGTGNIGIVDVPGPVTEVIIPTRGIGTPGCTGYNNIGRRL